MRARRTDWPGLPIPFLLAVTLAAPAWSVDVERTKDIRISKLDSVRVSDLDDFVFPPSTDVPLPLTDGVCIFSSSGGRYQVTATSANGRGGEFRLAGDAGYIAYGVVWQVSGGFVDLRSGRDSPIQSGASRTSPTCDGGTTANLKLTLDPATYSAALPGIYADTLTITVAPD